MIRTARVALVAFVLAVAVAAQASLTGEWAMSFTTPRGGRSEYTLYMTQEGPRLTGHLTSEYGETPVKGDSINGTIKLGAVGEGTFTAERTGSELAAAVR